MRSRTEEQRKQNHEYLFESLKNTLFKDAYSNPLIQAYEDGYEQGYDDCLQDEKANESFNTGFRTAGDCIEQNVLDLHLEPQIEQGIISAICKAFEDEGVNRWWDSE